MSGEPKGEVDQGKKSFMGMPVSFYRPVDSSVLPAMAIAILAISTWALGAAS